MLYKICCIRQVIRCEISKHAHQFWNNYIKWNCWIIYLTDSFYKEMWNCYNNVLGRLEKNINDVEMRISYWLHHSSISKSSWKIPISFTMNAITVTIVSIFSYKQNLYFLNLKEKLNDHCTFNDSRRLGEAHDSRYLLHRWNCDD